MWGQRASDPPRVNYTATAVKDTAIVPNLGATVPKTEHEFIIWSDMTNAMCLKCQSYKPIAQYYSDPPIDHVISTEWKCEKGLSPKDVYVEAQTGIPSVVAVDCNSFLNRAKILARKVEGNRE